MSAPSACTICGRQGVVIKKTFKCPKCNRTNFYCAGCAVRDINLRRSTTCKCVYKQRAIRRNKRRRR